MEHFDKIREQMRLHGMKLPQERVHIRVPDAKAVLHSTMSSFIAHEGKTMQWLPEYDAVAAWLTANNGRGLFMYGNCGRGKSLLTRYALPAILLSCCRRVVSVFDTQEMNRDIDHVLSKRLIAIDDVGTEEVSIKYGVRRLAFAEIMDACEKESRLAIVSTNLSVNEIRQRYGERTFDRIRSTTQQVLFEGKSLRG
mgnify:CR=1 FL=1